VNSRIVYINGQLTPLDQARISPLDRGFLFADGVYEVIPVYAGNPFRLKEHLHRLQASLDGIRLVNPLDDTDWEAAIGSVIIENGGGDQSIYLQVTRGAYAVRDHGFPDKTTPTVFIMATPGKGKRDGQIQTASAITIPDIRWQNCHLKTIALLPNILLRQEALDSGTSEAILYREDWITEGAASNVFMVSNGEILTPPKGPRLLPGITRDLVLELATAHGIPNRETEISRGDLCGADEIWLTSSTREILPVTELDKKPVGSGDPGLVWQQMSKIYRAFTDRLRSGASID